MNAPERAPERVISNEELQQYHRDGFLIVQGLYPRDEMSQMKATVRKLLGEEKAANQSGVRVWMPDALFPELREAMRDNHVVPILTQLIGPDIEFLSVKAVFKDPEVQFGTPWHQDWFYWRGSEKISVWIALDDAAPENGCLRFIPGTHKMQLTNRRVKEDKFGNRSDEAELEGLPIVDAVAARGDVVFFSDKTVHGSYSNTARKDRWSFISTYRDASIPDEATTWARGMLVAGTRQVNLA